MTFELRVPCPTCSGSRSTTTGDRHADTNMDVCATCHDEGTILARPGETPEASYQPAQGADAKLQQALADFIGLGLPLCSSRDMAIHFLGATSPLASLVAERDAAVAELERVLDPEMKDLRLANGGIDMAVAGPMVERLAVAMTGWFRQSGAENYVEMGLNARTEPFERYCVTVQKYGALSPHQLRKAAEDRASAAESEITRLKEGMEARERALGLALRFVDRAAGEGLSFDADGDRPAMDAADVCFAVAEALSIEDLDSDAYRALIAYPDPPTLALGGTND